MFEGETILSGAPVDEHVSEFKVMRSGAGYYIGTMYRYCGKCDDCIKEWGEDVISVPNTRETGYFATHEEAYEALQHMSGTGHLPGKRTLGYKGVGDDG